MTTEALREGRAAEVRVVTLAQQLGFEARLATLYEDAHKVDAVIADTPFQVSTTGKSKGQQRRLEARGIKHVVGGIGCEDFDVKAQIMSQLLGYD